MDEITWPKKLADSIEKTAGKNIRETIMKGSEELEKADEKTKAKWSKQAMDKLNELVPDHNRKVEIMSRCSCSCADGLIDDLRAAWKRLGDIDKLLEYMYQNPFYVKPVRENNIIYFTKAPKNPTWFAEARTKKDKAYYYCHCDYAKAAEDGFSMTHCLCGAGWYKRIWEGILEKDVRVDIVRSVLNGDEDCTFAVHI